MGTAHQTEVHDPTIVKGDCHLEQEIHVATGCTLVQMHVTHWAETQKEDPMLSRVLNWLKAQKKTDLKALLAEHTSSKEHQLILWNWQNFMIHHTALYLYLMPKVKTKDLLLFIVPRAHCVTASNGCHRDAGHQGHNHSLSLLLEHLWWSCMANQMQHYIKSYVYCLQHEGNLSKAPLHPIVTTTLMDLLHVDFTSMEPTLQLNRSPKVANVLVFQNHFTKHVMAYVSPNQATKTVAKFLYEGYILILGVLARLLIGVLTSCTTSLMRCVNTSVWGNYGPHHTIPRWMGWWRDHIKPPCKWSGSWGKTKRLTGQDIWLK